MLNLINRANNLSSWIIDIIVKGDTAEKRASAMTYFTRTARKCYEIKNFNTLFTIMTAQTSSAIRRMGLTWEALPTKTRALLGQLNRFISSADNYMNYRQELHQVNQQPCIPYLGVILSELTFIEEGNPTFLPGHPGVINFHKYRLYAKALRGIQRHQQVAYGIGVLKPVYQHLKDLDPVPDEKELLRRSAVAEPDL
ncbi:ras guanine nucleotide exchange factor J-like [Oscarella lobularis]|uniref:ras guanine nucleotide exchange factor J-like n=1 Tax=Oscarella lobularis TaxID=121494 RepID=UPI003313E52E